ncbi:DUF7935 family protein [Salinimicrobium soli]|uniref:DUF7935 family protein n=1 Tax=Salinimicrobium soli TaxID=1254399 RepID=UPI003AACD49A
MTEEYILQGVFYLLPAVVVGIISFYFFNLHTKNEEQRRRFLLHRENQKQALPLRLQAYERMTLFLERIAPGNLLVRIRPTSSKKDSYTSLLVRTIEQEFEHNLAQQIYLSEECWNVIKASKNATIARIRKVSENESIETADELRQHILKSLQEQQPPSETGLLYIKKEVTALW